MCPPPDQSQPPLQPASPLPAPSPYTEQTGGFTEHCEPVSHPSSPICTARTSRRVPRPRPPPLPGTHTMALCPSSVPLHVPLLPPPESSLPPIPDPEFDLAHAASALVVELVDFAASCRLDYATALVAESESASPPSVGGECALDTDVLDDTQEDFECLAAAVPHFASVLLAPEGDLDAPDIPTPRSYTEAITGPYSSQWHIAMDAEMASWKSTGTYVDAVPPSGAITVDGMWIFRVKRPPGSPPAFKARYVARDFSQRQGVDYFQTFTPTPKMTTLRVLLHVAAQRDYELHSLDFSTAFLQGSLHEEIWLRRPPGFTRSFPAGTQWSLRRPVYGLRQAPRDADPWLFLRTDTSLPPFYVLVYITRDRARRTITLTQSPSQLYLRTTPILSRYVALGRHRPEHWEAAKRVLRYLCSTLGMGLVLGGRGPVVLTDHADASWVDDLATQQSSQGYTFSLGSGSFSWRSTRSSSVPVVRLRSTQGQQLHRIYAGSPTC
ncbi:unnamed protein product [Closterium sp. NIES-53]